MLEQVEASEFVQDLKMNVLQAIRYIIQSWDEITADTIKNCWNHTKILPNSIPLDDIYYEDDHLMFDDELAEAIEALNLSNRMGVKEFLTIPEEEIIYKIPEDLEIADLFKEPDINHSDEIDDSIEVEIIGIKEALQSLKTMHMFYFNKKMQVNK